MDVTNTLTEIGLRVLILWISSSSVVSVHAQEGGQNTGEFHGSNLKPFSIQILAWRREKHLKNLLASLSNAYYSSSSLFLDHADGSCSSSATANSNDDIIDIVIHLDGGYSDEVLEIAEDFQQNGWWTSGLSKCANLNKN